MLNGLAGFIFGKLPNNDGQEKSVNPAECTEPSLTPAGRENIGSEEEFKMVDDEWLMVDVRSDPPVDLDIVLPSSTESSGASSPTAVDHERGWNLTPPPCFTASFQRDKRRNSKNDHGDKNGGQRVGVNNTNNNHAVHRTTHVDPSTTTVLETSNFENLLIEHPSMSVYHRRRPPVVIDASATQGSQTQPSLTNDTGRIDEEETASETQQQQQQPEAIAVREAHRLLAAESTSPAARLADLEVQQRAERVNQTGQLSANRIRRANAVANAQTVMSHKQQRKNRMKNPAGRCNDRKCQ